MVEILTMGRFCDWVADMAGARGHDIRKNRMMAMILWCAGEAAGLFSGLIIAPSDGMAALLVIYLCALAGAGIGAGFAIAIVRIQKADPIRVALFSVPTSGK